MVVFAPPVMEVPRSPPAPGGEDARTKLLISPGPSKAELLNKTCGAPVSDVLTRTNTALRFFFLYLKISSNIFRRPLLVTLVPSVTVCNKLYLDATSINFCRDFLLHGISVCTVPIPVSQGAFGKLKSLASIMSGVGA